MSDNAPATNGHGTAVLDLNLNVDAARAELAVVEPEPTDELRAQAEAQVAQLLSIDPTNDEARSSGPRRGRLDGTRPAAPVRPPGAGCCRRRSRRSPTAPRTAARSPSRCPTCASRSRSSTRRGSTPMPGGSLGSIGRIPGVGTPLKRYFMRYESSQTQIDAIVNSLEKGRDQLKRDNVTLGDDQKQMRELTHQLADQIALAQALDAVVVDKLATEIAADDPRRQFVEEDILFALRQRTARPPAATRRQPAGRARDRDHHPQQPRADPRRRSRHRRHHQRAAGRGDRGARAGAPEDRARQDRGDQHDHVGDDRRHGRAPQDAGHRRSTSRRRARCSTWSRCRQAFADIDTALDEISRYRREALPTMAGTILELDQLTAESEAAIEQMEQRPHGDCANRRRRRRHRRRRDHGEGERVTGVTRRRRRSESRSPLVVGAIAFVAAACGTDETQRAARPGAALRAARRTRRRHRLDRQPGDPERVDPAADGSQPRRHAAADRRVPASGSRRRRASRRSRCGRRRRSPANSARPTPG